MGRPYLGMFMLGSNKTMPRMVPAVMFGFVDRWRASYGKRRVTGIWSLDHCRIRAETEDANLVLWSQK
jgi:hypothetical protein